VPLRMLAEFDGRAEADAQRLRGGAIAAQARRGLSRDRVGAGLDVGAGRAQSGSRNSSASMQRALPPPTASIVGMATGRRVV